jgi:hypothetical protein
MLGARFRHLVVKTALYQWQVKMYKWMIGLIAVMALVLPGAAAAVQSDVSFAGAGHIYTASELVTEADGSIIALTSNTFGNAVISYGSMVKDVSAFRAIDSQAGKIIASDSMMNLAWVKGNLSCGEDGTCTGTPSSYALVTAGSTVVMQGPGSLGTASTANSYALAAQGYGSISQWANVNALKEVCTTTGEGETVKTTCSIEGLKYSEMNRVVGGYDYLSTFTYFA